MKTSQAFSLDNVSITGDIHWWGFVLHLNEDAVKLLEEIRDLAEKLAKYLDPELVLPVKIAILIEKEWIKLVDRGNGVKLVSPWISPTMLIPLPDSVQHVDDNNLYWTVYDPDHGWSDDVKFPANQAEVGPALADFGGRLTCVHRGPAGNSFLQQTFHDPDQGWTRDVNIPAHVTSSELALAVYRGQLYCLHKGDGGDPSLWWTTTSDGVNWSDDHRMPTQLSSAGPAAAVFNDQLVCLHPGAGDDSVFWTAFDGNSWSPDQRLPFRSTMKVALAVFQNRLHCVYLATNADLYWTAFDGGSWADSQRLYAYASGGPAMAVFQDRLHCVYVGGASDCSLYQATFDGSQWSGFHRTTARGNDVPALLNYQGKHATKNQLLCVHRGYRT